MLATAPDFVTCPFDPTHALPAAHILSHVLKVHGGEPLNTADQCMSSFASAALKRVREEAFAGGAQAVHRAQPAGPVAEAVHATAPPTYTPDPHDPYATDVAARLHIGYFGNVPPENVLKEYLGRYGTVVKMFHSHNKKCFFAELSSAAEAEAALENGLIRRQYAGFTLFIHPALRPGTQRPPDRAPLESTAPSHPRMAPPSGPSTMQAPSTNPAPTPLATDAVRPVSAAPVVAAAVAAHPAPPPASAPASSTPTWTQSAGDHPRINAPATKPPSPIIMLHNVPTGMNELDIVRALKTLQVSDPTLVTLVATLPSASIRSVVVDFPGEKEAARALHIIQNATSMSVFRGERVTAQFV